MASMLKSLRGRGPLIVFLLLLVGGSLAIVTLGREVLDDLETQRAAEADNLQFTLAQVEVDYLTFKNVIDTYEGGPADTAELRRRFDVLYSRIFTLRQGRQLANLRRVPEWNRPLMRVALWLDDIAKTIDGPEATLQTELDRLRAETEGLRTDVRNLSIVALSFFASNSDSIRAQTTLTLTRLAAVIVALFGLLLGLSLYLLAVNRKVLTREEALAQTYQRLNKIQSTALDAVIVADRNGRVTEFNPAAEAIFGYSSSYAKGRTISELIVPDHLRGAHDAGMERMHSGGDRHVIGKGRVKMEAQRANGQRFPVEIALQTATDQGEEIIIGFVRDISQLVANEKELISARDRALAGEQAKADFLTVMSHEIRTPLNGLLGNLSLLKESGTDAERQRLVHNMDISGQVLLNHVDSVLDIARFEAGKLALQSTAVNLDDLLQRVVDGQSGNAAGRDNTLSWHWVGRPRPHVTADEQRLRQIFLNLVGNAIKFTDSGDILIEAEVSEMVPGSNRAVFEFRVIDSGIGIAARDQARIFKDFETVDPSIERITEGTGLGLAISQRLVHLLGGEIGVESILGEGSVFWVRLPLELRRPAQDPEAKPKDAPVQAPQSILVVEDNAINLELTQTMLERDGHRVTLATDGTEGVRKATETRFDVILMDISMPVMDGLTATRHIRSGTGASRETPIVALSANVLPDAVLRIREAGMNAFLGKPVSVEKMRATLGALRTESWVDGSDALSKSTFDETRQELGEARFCKLLKALRTEMDAAQETGHALDWQDAEAVAAYQTDCHRLAGSAAVFGLTDLRAALLTLEQTPAGATDQARSRLRSFETIWRREKTAIETLLAEQA